MPTPRSRIFEVPPADSETAQKHFIAKLAVEVDPSDLHTDMEQKIAGFVVVDGRSPESYEKGHIPGAINLWHRRIDAASTAKFSKDTLFITYCTGVGCNASTKAAVNLCGFGFRVKELIGGLTEWEREGYEVKVGPQP